MEFFQVLTNLFKLAEKRVKLVRSNIHS
jgi:hypothetical protein